MKKVFFLAIIALYVLSCTKEPDHTEPNLDINNFMWGSDLRILINAQNDAIDINALIKDLKTKSLQSIYWQASMSNTYALTKDQTLRYCLDSDGTGRMYRCNEDGSTAITYSREWEWDISDSEELVMTDEYGNECRAKILYYDGDIVCYSGALCGEFKALDGVEIVDDSKIRYSVAKFVDDRTSWITDSMVSHEVLYNGFLDEDDQRIVKIIECSETPAEIDDEAFVNKLLNSAFVIKNQYDGTKTGCIYGDICFYIKKGGEYFWKHLDEKKLIFMEDGICRECFVYVHHENEEENDRLYSKVYAEENWRYDADTNTLITGYTDTDMEWQANVIYYSGDIAILEGNVMYANTKDGYDGSYFYIDFELADRKAILEEYATNYSDYVTE